jgi:hypothetical protein
VKSSRSEPMDSANLWPTRILLAVLASLLVRIVEHLIGYRMFDLGEFTNLPVLSVVFISVYAIIENSVLSNNSKSASHQSQSATSEQTNNSERRRAIKPWLFMIALLILLIVIRTVVHLAGWLDLNESGFLSLPIVICIALMVGMVWSWRIR